MKALILFIVFLFNVSCVSTNIKKSDHQEVKKSILETLHRNKHQLETCYEFAVQKKPDLEGKVLIQWNIVNERAKNIKIKNNTTDESPLARCLMSRLHNLRFTGTGLAKNQIAEITIPFTVKR